jgi:hypothetical protein
MGKTFSKAQLKGAESKKTVSKKKNGSKFFNPKNFTCDGYGYYPDGSKCKGCSDCSF